MYIYRGIERNNWKDFDDPPNRPGQREEHYIDAIQDAIAQDSQNPTDITLPQGKTALWGPGLSANSSAFIKKVFFNVLAPKDVEVYILDGILPISAGMDTAGVDANIRINAHYDFESNMDTAEISIFCGLSGCNEYEAQVYYQPSTRFLPYDAGPDAGYFCVFPGALGYVGSPGHVTMINRLSDYTDVNVWGEITYRFKEGII